MEHAVVVGASMTGMLAARVLADRARVTLVERDALPDGREPRRGVPQAYHLHALLARGMSLIERWFPGLRQQLVDAGGVVADGGFEIGWLGPFGWSPGYEPGLLLTLWATRGFLDEHLRRRLRLDNRIAWMENTRVAGVTLDGARRRVTGVRTEDGRTIAADFVVDATGRGSPLPSWLREHALPSPKETVVDAGLGYASALVRLTRPIPNGWKVVFLLGVPPEAPGGGALSLVEDGRTLVTLITSGGKTPPADPRAMVEYARTLRSPVIADLLQEAEWLSPVRTNGSTANRRRHYERLEMPSGLVAMGDSMCAFNPAYGQGITVAAMQADALAAMTSASAASLASPSLGPRLHRAFARAAGFPWAAATSADFRSPETRGERTPGLRVVHAYLDRVFAASVEDRGVSRALGLVFNLAASPLTMYGPRVMWSALRRPARKPLLGPVALPQRS